MDTPIISWLIYLLLLLPFIAMALIFAFALLFYKKKNKQAARQLILAIKSSEDDDKAALSDFLQKKIGLDDKKANKLVKKIGNERKFFFRNLIASLLNQKNDSLSELNADLNRIFSHYHSLQIQVQAAEAEVEEDGDAQEKIDQLKGEVKNLKHEVHITLTTLNNIFAEFSSMFGEEVPNREMSVDQIITAMESFAGKGQVAEVNDSPAVESMDESPTVAEDDDIELEDDDDIESMVDEETVNQVEASQNEDISIDDELDEIDSALDELELSAVEDGAKESDEPSWDEAFEESGDSKE